MQATSRSRAWRRKSQQGSVLVELSFVLPVFLLIAIAVGYVGRVLYFSIGVTNAARAGAGYGIRERYTDYSGMRTKAVEDAQANLPGFTTANVPVATHYCECPAPEGRLTSCFDAGGLVHQCAEPGYGPPQVYVRVDTTYTFSAFGTGADGNPVQVCVRDQCLPSVMVLNGHAIMRAR